MTVNDRKKLLFFDNHNGNRMKKEEQSGIAHPFTIEIAYRIKEKNR
ncbi:hypothetical protein [Paenibacillus mesophilus]|nr:hypothetical protein [Paenibacillus mesophilus]